MVCSYSKHTFFVAIFKNDSSWTHRVMIELHKSSLNLNYTIGCSHVYIPLKKRVSNECMETNIKFGSFSRIIYLGRLRKILSVMPLLFTIIILHTFYILISIALSLLLFGNAIFEAWALRRTWTPLKLLASKRPITLVHSIWHLMPQSRKGMTSNILVSISKCCIA